METLTSESIKEVAKALSSAQAEIKGAEKHSENPFFKSGYANLIAIWNAIRLPFTKNGLAVSQVTQPCEPNNLGTMLITLLMHQTGEWIKSTIYISPQRDAQAFGKELTYRRRQSLSAIAGAAEADDDGEAAAGRGEDDNKKAPAKVEKKVETPPVDRLGSLRRKMFAIRGEQGWTDMQLKELMTQKYKVDSSLKLTQNQMDFLILFMKENPKEKKLKLSAKLPPTAGMSAEDNMQFNDANEDDEGPFPFEK